MAVDKMWGVGTAVLLEQTVRAYPSIKGTYLNDIDFRLSLEKYFKDLTAALESGISKPQECIQTVWTDWGMPLQGQGEYNENRD